MGRFQTVLAALVIARLLMADVDSANLLSGSSKIAPVAPGELPPLETAPDGARFLRFRFEKDHVRVHFAEFRLPVGAQVYLIGADAAGTVVEQQGPFEQSGPTQSGEFWAGPVRGRPIVEFRVPAGAVPPDIPFRIVEIAPAEPAEGSAAAVRDSEPVAVVEHDILINSDDRRHTQSSKNAHRESTGIPDLRYRWPNGVMPYEIDPALPNQGRIRDGIAHWNRMMRGVVQLVPHNGEPNYVVYQRPADAGNCSSYVGMQGGRQPINMGDFCGTGNVIHETGHAFGLWHEQARNDRDDHVRVLWDNIQSSVAFNFNKTNANGEDLGDYDFASIMHYGPYAFSANGKPTLETIPAGIPIGQRDSLSTGDINGIRALYGAPLVGPSVDITITSNPSGVILTVDGQQVTTPYPVRWETATIHTVAAPESIETAVVHMTFVRWSDGGDAQHDVIAGAATPMYSVDFARSYRITADATPEQAGTVKVSPASPDGYYAENTTVRLEPVAKTGYCFSGWSGLLPGSPARASLVAAKSYEPAANFQPGTYTLSRSLDYVGREGGHLHLDVTANSGCVWDASAASDWVSVAVSGGSGNGTVDVVVAPNTTGHTRIGTVHILSRSWVIVQADR